MRTGFKRVSVEPRSFSAAREHQWKALCARYLPLAPAGSIWRYSRDSKSDAPEQGWKLHVSATILTAHNVLEAVAPFLQKRGTQFKAVSSLGELSRLNSGLYYGYSQVGKFITVYPESDVEALFLAERLHDLTSEMSGPAAPFDEKFRGNSCISYRYGSFRALEIENPDGTRALAIRDPQGNLVPDQREALKPTWIPDLFPAVSAIEPNESPLKTTYRVFTALVQRGKGGVYKAIDLSTHPPRLCVIKEGRQHGETNWDSRDGRWRVENEKKVLHALRSAGVEVPCIYDSFEVENNFYLVTEFVEGATLQAHLNRRRRRLSSAQVVVYAARLAELISRIHAAGWTWRDCKPTNIIFTKAGSLRPLDFEGACPIAQPDSVPWGTPGYVPPEWKHHHSGQLPEAQDLYALGSIVYLLLTGILPTISRPIPVERLRRNVHPVLRHITRHLLHPDALKRPPAIKIMRILNKAAIEGSPNAF